MSEMFLNIHPISVIVAQINSHSKYIPHLKPLERAMAMLVRGKAAKWHCLAGDNLGFLRFFLVLNLSS